MSNFRKEYSHGELRSFHLSPSPFDQFLRWLKEAIHSPVSEPNALVLATATLTGKPSCRTVLMKDFSEKGLLFYTNYESRKGKELEENPYAAALFSWHLIERQVHMEGRVERLTEEESRHYFEQRPRRSQIAAWASHQDQPIANRASLENAFQAYEQQFEGREVPIPPYWGGYRLLPEKFEFWQGRVDRLHDRFLYFKQGENWSIQRISP